MDSIIIGFFNDTALTDVFGFLIYYKYISSHVSKWFNIGVSNLSDKLSLVYDNFYRQKRERERERDREREGEGGREREREGERERERERESPYFRSIGQ